MEEDATRVGHNSADRLVLLLRKVDSFPENILAADAWARLFELSEDQGAISRDLAVTQRLSWLNDQLQNVRLQLQQDGNEERFAAKLGKIEAALSPRLLGRPWKHVRDQLLATGVLDVLDAFAVLLPQVSIDPVALKEVAEAIARSREIIDGSGIPDDLRSFLEHVLDISAEALREYPFRGPEAVQDAAQRIIYEWSANRDLVEDYRETEAVQSVLHVWSPLAKRVGTFTRSLATAVNVIVGVMTITGTLPKSPEVRLLPPPALEAPPGGPEQGVPKTPAGYVDRSAEV